MRTTFVIATIISLGIASLFFVGSGFAGYLGQEENPGHQIGDDLESTAANESAVDGNGSVSGSRQGGESSSIVGLVLGSARKIVAILKLTVLLPLTLQNFGFPLWFAAPLGLVAQLIATVGLIQFITGRIWR